VEYELDVQGSDFRRLTFRVITLRRGDRRRIPDKVLEEVEEAFNFMSFQLTLLPSLLLPLLHHQDTCREPIRVEELRNCRLKMKQTANLEHLNNLDFTDQGNLTEIKHYNGQHIHQPSHGI
jgi:hypothetical protein